MQKIHIETGPAIKSYGTFENAVTAPNEHPSEEKAQESSALLETSEVALTQWSKKTCRITFANGRVLQIRANEFQLEWDVSGDVVSHPLEEPAPVEMVWGSGAVTVFDPNSDFTCIAGSRFLKLFVNEVGLLLYTQGNPILWFHAYRNRETGEDVLHACFD